MRITSKFFGAAAAASLLATTACVTDPDTGERKISKAAIGGAVGAVVGYFGGDIIGGRRDRTERIVGTGVGALAGAAVGAASGAATAPGPDVCPYGAYRGRDGLFYCR